MTYTKEEFEILTQKLIDKGYTHYKHQTWKSCSSIFWKSFHKTYDEYGEKIIPYQVGFAVYDFTKYEQLNKEHQKISIAYEFLLGADIYNIDRLDLTISDSKMTIEEFEIFCENFYQSSIIKDLKK
jgi:hypothetical protein